MLLAEELLLLAVTSPDASTMSSFGGLRTIDIGLAGAVLIELAMLDHVRLTERGEPAGAGRLVVRPGPPPAHPVLTAALDRLSCCQGRKPHNTLTVLQRGLATHLEGRLVAGGVLQMTWARDRAGFLKDWIVVTNPAPVTVVRGRVGSALLRTDLDERTAALVGLLSALNALTAVFDTRGQAAIRQRAKEIADRHWAIVAVRTLVKARSQFGISWWF